MVRERGKCIPDGLTNLVAGIIRQAVLDLNAPQLEKQLDAILFLLSPLCEDYLNMLGMNRISPLRVIYELGKVKRFKASEDIVSLIADLNKNQTVLWRKLVLQELPRIREMVLTASDEELAQAIDEHSEEGLEAIVEPSGRLFWGNR